MTAREYPSRPLVGIGCVVFRAGSVLLIRRARAPALGAWSLPGGAQKLGETAAEAACREVREETGVTIGQPHLVGVIDSIHRDATGRIRYHYTIIDYTAPWRSGEPRPGGDVDQARFVPCADLAAYSLAQAVIDIVEKANIQRAAPGT